jgi:hypothetical protein
MEARQQHKKEREVEQKNFEGHARQFVEKARETVQEVGREFIRQKIGINLSQEQIDRTAIPTQELSHERQRQRR